MRCPTSLLPVLYARPPAPHYELADTSIDGGVHPCVFQTACWPQPLHHCCADFTIHSRAPCSRGPEAVPARRQTPQADGWGSTATRCAWPPDGPPARRLWRWRRRTPQPALVGWLPTFTAQQRGETGIMEVVGSCGDGSQVSRLAVAAAAQARPAAVQEQPSCRPGLTQHKYTRHLALPLLHRKLRHQGTCLHDAFP